MKQTIQLRLGQQLTMTPQLQQAIKLLQLSTLDLQREIQDALESNLMLENPKRSTPGEVRSQRCGGRVARTRPMPGRQRGAPGAVGDAGRTAGGQLLERYL
jgi:DNA-directed RNA polymerase specialized sigma54-like protein